MAQEPTSIHSESITINEHIMEELKILFETDDTNDVFYGFDTNDSIDLDALFLRESSDEEFLGFVANDSIDLDDLFQRESSDEEFLGF